MDELYSRMLSDWNQHTDNFICTWSNKLSMNEILEKMYPSTFSTYSQLKNLIEN